MFSLICKFIPTNKQWKNWSLPSKYTAISFFIMVFSLLVGAINWLSTTNEGMRNEVETDPKVVVTNARYGFYEMRDHTDWFVKRCQDSVGGCNFVMMPDKELGDHEHFIEKELSIFYDCKNGEQDKTFRLEPIREPARRQISLDCS